MDSILHFFRDILNGPLYYIIVVLGIILLMAIIGFLMERKQLEKEEKEKIATVSNFADVSVSLVAVPEEEIQKSENSVTAQVSNMIDFGSTTTVIPTPTEETTPITVSAPVVTIETNTLQNLTTPEGSNVIDFGSTSIVGIPGPVVQIPVVASVESPVIEPAESVIPSLILNTPEKK